MKNYNLVKLAGLTFLVTLFLFSCNNEQHPKTAESPAEKKGGMGLVGYWANANWWQALKETKSPMKAAAFAEISFAHIYQDSSQLVADVVYNWHEGMQYWLQPNDSKFDLINPYDKVKTHEIVLQPDGSARLDTFTFIQIDMGKNEDPSKAAAARVLGGTYVVNGTSAQVVFNEEGTITGLDDYKTYNILTDYVTDEIGSDQLMLDRGNDQPDFYAFKIEGNQLTISFIEQDESVKAAAVYKVGKPKMLLTKSGQ
ncbi:MAG: hypothetical protein H6577_21490 [Lewinellaceae bacterium]|nr:hypothetical protein [Saprospiraceae bacterium]MCB9340706.1 hypothetical protein [Lewinellaceae bacterium]